MLFFSKLNKSPIKLALLMSHFLLSFSDLLLFFIETDLELSFLIFEFQFLLKDLGLFLRNVCLSIFMNVICSDFLLQELLLLLLQLFLSSFQGLEQLVEASLSHEYARLPLLGVGLLPISHYGLLFRTDVLQGSTLKFRWSLFYCKSV